MSIKNKKKSKKSSEIESPRIAKKSGVKSYNLNSNLYDAYILPVTIFICTLVISLSIFISANRISDTLNSSLEDVSLDKSVTGVSDTAGGTVVSPTTSPEPEVKFAQLALGDDAYLGNKDTAKVVVMEFSDYTCGYCQRFHSETYSGIKSQYVDTGKVLFVYRDFSIFDPVPAQVNQCVRRAHDDEAFYKMHDAIFDGGSKFDKAGLIGLAKGLGYDDAKIQSCLDKEEYKKVLDASYKDAKTLGLTGTPGFLVGRIKDGGVIDGQVVAGAYPLSEFQRIIDSYLKE